MSHCEFRKEFCEGCSIVGPSSRFNVVARPPQQMRVIFQMLPLHCKHEICAAKAVALFSRSAAPHFFVQKKKSLSSKIEHMNVVASPRAWQRAAARNGDSKWNLRTTLLITESQRERVLHHYFNIFIFSFFCFPFYFSITQWDQTEPGEHTRTHTLRRISFFKKGEHASMVHRQKVASMNRPRL